MTARVLIVGRAPSKTSDPERPLAGSLSGRRLCDLAGVQPGQFWRAFEAVNLVDRWPGPAKGGGDLFPRQEARAGALDVVRMVPGRRVLLLGPEVAQAFHVTAPLLCWRDGCPMMPAASWAVFPHPSGVSRYWNDAEQAFEAARFLQDAAREVLGADPEAHDGAHPGLDFGP